MKEKGFQNLPEEIKNQILLSSQEMNQFYSLRTKERQAVLNSITDVKKELEKK